MEAPCIHSGLCAPGPAAGFQQWKSREPARSSVGASCICHASLCTARYRRLVDLEAAVADIQSGLCSHRRYLCQLNCLGVFGGAGTVLTSICSAYHQTAFADAKWPVHGVKQC